ncbi:MAG: hypothetical protein GY941_01890 [Planctomycetes bacterium]|nr:hypothetical protein [Planctomycetota bacterium]
MQKTIDMPVTISFRIIPLVAMNRISAVWNRVAIRNFGTDGFCFYFNENLEAGSLLDVKIDFLKVGHTANCIGEIKCIGQSLPSSLFYITIKFKNMKKQEKEMIKHIEHIYPSRIHKN